MPDVANRSVADEPADASIELAVSTLRFADGVVLDDAAPFAAALVPPVKVARSRHNEQLLFFFESTGAVAPNLCRDLRDIVTEVYWSTVGSATAALRRAASVSNRYLFEHNLNSEPSKRCYGGLSCAVVRHRDLFLLQAGPAWTCVLQAEGRLKCFPRGEKLAHLGIGPVSDVRLNHIFAAIGDTLLMASPALLREAGQDGLLRILPREEVSSVVEGLGELEVDADFTALVARWERPPLAEVSKPRPARQIERAEPSASISETPPKPREVPEPPIREPRAIEKAAAKPRRTAKRRSPIREQAVQKKIARGAGKTLESGWRGVARALGYVWHAIAAAGAGMVALGKWLLGAIGTTIRGMLPGAQRKAYRRSHRPPPPDENSTVLAGVAVGILVVVIGVVVVAYLNLAAKSRFQGIIKEAEEQIALAQAARSDSEEARIHWEQALERVETAATLQPNDPSAQILQQQAQDALDQLDRIERVTLTQLVDFGSGNVERRLVFNEQALFVLDPRDGWGARVPLGGVDPQSGVENASVLVRTGQQVERDEVDQLVDCAWADRDGGRQSSALLILEEDGGLLSYDPAWGTESGAPQLTRVELSTPLPREPIAAGTYNGQFYILDADENGGQIWRYKPQGNAFSQPREPYFATPPDGDLQNAVDMAIDGHIYILYSDGTVDKFLGGELQEFEIRDVPNGLGEVSAFAVDPSGSGVVYLADRGNGRVVELHPDGRFKAQFRADFNALEALAVGGGEGTLYVLDGGRLYMAALP